MNDIPNELWIVFDGAGVEATFTNRKSAMEIAAMAASEYPNAGPWRVKKFVQAKDETNEMYEQAVDGSGNE